MKASYIIALFAAFAVANAWGSDVHNKDSKTQYQSASGTQSEISNGSGGLIRADGILKNANVFGSSEKNANIEQVANQ